jgi:hypothetical protein
MSGHPQHTVLLVCLVMLLPELSLHNSYLHLNYTQINIKLVNTTYSNNSLQNMVMQIVRKLTSLETGHSSSDKLYILCI